MGCCLSKKDPCSKSVISSSNNNNNLNNIPKPQENDLKIATQKLHNNVTAQIELQKRSISGEIDEEKGDEKEIDTEKAKKKKEVFVIQHRKSNDKRPDSDGSGSGSGSNVSDPESVGRNLIMAAANGQVVRTSSCTKEEVDAILIQCGRLSRSSSGKGHGRKYSGSKRSFDFDRENEGGGIGEEGEGGEVVEEERLRRRQSRGSNRRSPMSSRERGEQRSGSRERSSGGRRVSRSPGRRSDSPMSSNGNGNGNGNGNNSVGSGSGRPGKLVSVPATVTSLSIDKGNNGSGSGSGGGDNGNVKRVLVKRNVGSPRSQSPARGNQVNGSGTGNGRSQSPAKANQVNGTGNGRSQSPANGNQVNGNGRSQSPVRGNQTGMNGNGAGQQPASISRNGSRKAEQSPYRRTPLNEIDLNSLPFQPLANKRPLGKGKEIEEEGLVVKQPINSVSQVAAPQATHRRTRSRGAEGYEITKTNYCRVDDMHTPDLEQMTETHVKDQLNAVEYDAMVTPVILSGTDSLKLPQTLVRSRSARRSRDFDINVDALLTPSPTPATNYTSLLLQDIQNFHQNKNSNTKTDTNSGSATNFTLPACVSKAQSILDAVADLNSTTRSNSSFAFSESNKKRSDPFVESEVKVGDDLMEPSLHKYVTVRKRGGDMDDEESSGSNSIVGQPNWVQSASWEPNSAESTDCWTSKSYSREDEISPAGFQKHAISDLGCRTLEDSGMKYSRNARDLQFAPLHQTGARSRTDTV
ncbi:hypothetical protein KSS87_015767 [Heliosperma pusillum]|nr:hypothetical protein KSS87_015767 [Heliosperma pusillum]